MKCLVLFYISLIIAEAHSSEAQGRALLDTNSGVLVTGGCSSSELTSTQKSNIANLAEVPIEEIDSIVDNLCSELVEDELPLNEAFVDAKGKQFIQNYFDGDTEWNNNEIISDLDAARITRLSDNGGYRLTFPANPEDYGSFENCDLNTVMCCYVNTGGVSNSEVCAVDFGDSATSSHIKFGYTLYNADINDETYCQGFTWTDGEVSDTYKGNTLFEMALVGNLVGKSYNSGVPGAPLCGCIEHMPTISGTVDCVEIDQEGYRFIMVDTELTVKVDFTYKSCAGDLKAEAPAGVADKIVDDCDAFVEDTMAHQFYSKDVPWWVPDPAKWTGLAGRGSHSFPSMTEDEFQVALDASSSKIIWRVCTSCQPSHRNIFLKRLQGSAPDGYLGMLKSKFTQEPENTMGQDFQLYSTLDDALNDTDAWTYCNYSTSKGMPSECGPESNVRNMYAHFGGRGGYADDVAFYIHTE